MSFSESFGDARFLWLLVLVPAFLAAYVLLQRRRPKDVVRFTNLALLESVVERSPRWRRHVPAAVFLLAMTALLGGLARPQATIKVPREEATIVLILDVSGSMKADDVQPDRITAAQDSARSFVDGLPPKFRVGLIAFSSTVRVLAPPTQDREQVRTAIDTLSAAGGTAMGDALINGVGLVRPEALAASEDGGIPPLDGGAINPDTAARVPASVLLISDGANTVGQTQPLDAADIANQLDVPVYTVALGTATGQALIPDGRGGSRLQTVPPDPDTLQAVAERTGGQFYDAPSAGQLEKVYDDIGSKIGFRKERKDATHWPLGAGVALLIVAAGLSLAWQQKLP
ncbi:MAG TPA: VWA domain-containing protein [Acidimicrobiales bacterium]|nr:VWA domain-containing protein [Acidimicrobiales bacterium]